jgi:catechol 2,3-dioxygenase
MSWGLISAMGHIGIQTTKLEESVFDATQILGLRETERTADAVYLAAGNVHHELVYVESDVDGVDSFGLVNNPGGRASRTASPSSGPRGSSSRSTSACRRT